MLSWIAGRAAALEPLVRCQPLGLRAQGEEEEEEVEDLGKEERDEHVLQHVQQRRRVARRARVATQLPFHPLR